MSGMSPGNAALVAAKFPPIIFIGVLWNIIGLGIEASIESAEDRQAVGQVQHAAGDYNPRAILADLFAAEIAKRPLFMLKPSAHTDYAALAKEGYDAVIKLDIEEASLRGAPGQFLRMFVRASGALVILRDQEIIWQQSETIMSLQEYPLSEYISDDGTKLKHILNDILQKIATRLASDIIYTR
jgi:hypothetical protein